MEILEYSNKLIILYETVAFNPLTLHFKHGNVMSEAAREKKLIRAMTK